MNRNLVENLLNKADGNNLYLPDYEVEKEFGVKFAKNFPEFKGVGYSIKGGVVPGDSINGRYDTVYSNKIVCLYKTDDIVVNVSFGTDGVKFSVQYKKNEKIEACWFRATSFDYSAEEDINDYILKVEKIEGVEFINTTPHPINFLSEETGKEYQVEPCGVILSATPEEKDFQFSPVKLVKTIFKPSQEGLEFLKTIPQGVVVVGSIIAAQAYPEQVVAMTPAKGFERVPPAEKRMNLFKFTVFPE